MSACETRHLPLLPTFMESDATCCPIVALSVRIKHSFETTAHLRPSFARNPKPQQCTLSSANQPHSIESILMPSPHYFEPRRSSRELTPSSAQHYDREDLSAKKFQHSWSRLLPLLPQACDGNTMMRPQEFLMFRRKCLPYDFKD
jgi:hypothetical protein